MQESNKNTKLSLVWAVCIGILLIVYLGIVVYLNMAKYAQHVDSDIAAEALLAREIWNEKSLTPDNWISSTERRIISMPMVAAVFYGMTGSMQTAVGIACVLIAAVFFCVFYWFFRKIELTKLSSALGVLMICALPINGLRLGEQIVPFVCQVLYLFAEYYVFHCILLLLSIIFYLHLKEKNVNNESLSVKDIVIWIFLFVLTLALSLGGQRCLQMVILPLIMYEGISLYVDSKDFTKRLPKKRWISVGYIGTTAVAFLLSLLYDRDANYVLYLQEPGEIFNRLFIKVPAAVLEGFGIAGNVKLGSFASLMQLLMWVVLALAIYGTIVLLQKRSSVISKQKEALLLLFTSFGVTFLIMCVTTAEIIHNYLMVSWFVMILSVVILIETYAKRKSFIKDILLLLICGFAILNLKYTWHNAVTTTDNLKEFEEVAQFLVEEEIQYGYAEFWDASRISLIVDGEVTMGHSYRIEELGMYWWLTSTEWYPPALQRDMRTAYVVKIEKKDLFEKQFTEEGLVSLEFENDRFAVYISEQNLICMP